MADWLSGLTYADSMELGLAQYGAGDPEAYNELLRRDAEDAALAKQVAKYGPGHGQAMMATQQGGGGPNDAPPPVQQDVARAEVLLVDPGQAPKRPPDKEPTYRLRKKMGLC